MPSEVQITFRDIEPSEAIAARIRERVAKLQQLHPRITSCRVSVEAAKRRQKATEYQVHIDLLLPGAELAVSHDHGEKKPADDMYVAIRNSFDALERRLKSMADRRRGEVKAHGAPPHGRIARLFPDHGFIATADGDVYFHRNAVAEGGFEEMEVGDEVRFALAPDDGDNGPQASTVHPLGKRTIIDKPVRP